MELAVQGLSHFVSPTVHVIRQLADIKNRYDKLQVSRTDVEKLSEAFIRIGNDLHGIRTADRHLLPGLAQNVINNCITDISQRIEDATKKLDAVQRNVKWTIVGMVGAHEHTTTLEMVDDDAKHCTELLATTAMNMSRGTIPQAPRYVAPVRPSRGADIEEPYLCRFPAQPHGWSDSLTLDFETMNDDNTFASCEGRLKSLVLGGSAFVGAVDNHAVDSRVGQVETAVALGGGGVGKTCALLAIAQQEDVKRRFPDGIFFFSLGADAGEEKVVEMLAEFVAASGGTNRAAEFAQSDLGTAIRVAASWFSGKTCLFIIDDVWKSRTIPSDILHKLYELVAPGTPGGGNSRIVYSTRDRLISKAVFGTSVNFDHRNTATSQEMLLKAAESDPGEVSESPEKEHFDSIVTMCGGLPFTLNIAGRLVVQMKETWIDEPNLAWRQCDEYLQKGNIVDQQDDEDHNLYVSLSASVEFLDKSRTVAEGCKFTEAVASLSVFNRQDWVPLSVCEHLWGVESPTARENMLRKLGELRIVTKESRRVAACPVLGFRFHDHVHAYATKLTAENGNVDWCARLVASYETTLQSDSKFHCWPALLQDDGYIIQNICRLLLKCGQRETVEKTLYSGQWVAKMMASGQVLQYDKDINAYMEELGVEFENNAPLRMLSKIVRLGQPDCFGHIHAAWFQLYARLQTAQPPQDWISRFRRASWGLIRHLTTPDDALRPVDWVTDIMMEAEQCAPRPFMRPSAPCLKYPTSALPEVFTPGHSVHRVRCLPNGDTVACAFNALDKSNSTAIMVVRDGSPAETRFLKTDHLHGFRDIVIAVCLSENGRHVASAHMNKKIRIWNTASLQQVLELDMDHTEQAWCISFNPDGTRIVSGANNGTVRVWDTATGVQVCLSLEGLMKVSSVCFSRDGTRIVAGFEDGVVRVLGAVTGDQVDVALNGHTDAVRSVNVSADGKYFVSGSDDHTVRIWAAKTGKHVRTIKGHTDAVRSVSFCADGTRIVSGSDDAKVWIWNAATGKQVGAVLTGHTDSVRNVSFSADSTRIISGSLDGTLRVWDTAGGEHVGEVLKSHTGWVKSVCFSADGTRMVSGSDDHTIRIWDTKAGVQVGTTLRGHTGCITRVLISADGTRVVSWSEGYAADYSVRLWNVDLAKTVKVIPVDEYGTKEEAEREAEKFLCDGSGTSGPRRVFKTDMNFVLLESEGSRARRVAAFDHRIRSHCVSSDGRRVGIGLPTGVVVILNVVGDS